ncbi:MAG: hypothetical protein M1818_002050 [Claussenomyces sp. TS43310]|nr:MAG: hypothetical protein M1818_002050 [Claussenomyces sp. TS43310]
MYPPRPPSAYISVFVVILATAVALVLAPTRYLTVARDLAHRAYSRVSTPAPVKQQFAGNMSTRTPIYFLSHGGPNVIYDTEHPAHSKLQEIGREVTQKVKPKGVVVFSAHWQGEPNVIEVNTAEDTDIIYDFYGFPESYYKAKYPHKGSTPLAEKVMSLLGASGIRAEPRQRGLDHGVWGIFKVAFDPETNPLNVPIVQVSLFDNEDPDQHYALGRAVSSLRTQNIQIVVSGMAVHNLRDIWLGMRTPGALAYTKTFDEALMGAATAAEEDGRQEKMAALLKRSDARRAHPTLEHLLPIFVGAGAAEDDRGKRLWTMHEGSLSWAQYRFGDLPSTNEVSVT